MSGEDADWRRYLHGEHAGMYRYVDGNHWLVDQRYKYIWMSRPVVNLSSICTRTRSRSATFRRKSISSPGASI